MADDPGAPIILIGNLEVTILDDCLRPKRIDGKELTEKDEQDLMEVEAYLRRLRSRQEAP